MAVKTKIDINKASKEELMSVEGIGEGIANAIIRYREQHGNISDLNELREINMLNNTRIHFIEENFSISRHYGKNS